MYSSLNCNVCLSCNLIFLLHFLTFFNLLAVLFNETIQPGPLSLWGHYNVGLLPSWDSFSKGLSNFQTASGIKLDFQFCICIQSYQNHHESTLWRHFLTHHYHRKMNTRNWCYIWQLFLVASTKHFFHHILIASNNDFQLLYKTIHVLYYYHPENVRPGTIWAIGLKSIQLSANYWHSRRLNIWNNFDCVKMLNTSTCLRRGIY